MASQPLTHIGSSPQGADANRHVLVVRRPEPRHGQQGFVRSFHDRRRTRPQTFKRKHVIYFVYTGIWFTFVEYVKPSFTEFFFILFVNLKQAVSPTVCFLFVQVRDFIISFVAMTKRATYWGIPCLFNESNNEITTSNWLYGLTIDFCVWLDVTFNDGFYIKIFED